MDSNLKVAAAVAAALAAGSSAAYSPTPAEAANPFVRLYIAGISPDKIYATQPPSAQPDNPLSISTEAITSVLQGAVGSTNWHSVADSSGKPVTTTSQPIVIVNREQGSGSRTATDIFFTTEECNKTIVKPIKEATGGTADHFSTGNALAAANSIPGSITYATIDYFDPDNLYYPNMTLVAVDGVTASNFNAAAGIYGAWFEATVVTNTTVSPLTTDQQSVVTYLTQALQNVATAPQAADILANPNYNSANGGFNVPSAGLPISSTAYGVNPSIYITPFTRSGNSCSVPANTL